MHANTATLWWARGLAFVLAALAAGSATFWTLKGSGGGAGTGAPLAQLQAPVVDATVVAHALGARAQAVAAAAEPELASRFKLLGVVADTVRGGGAALIAVDGKPARPVRVGAALDGDLVLQSLQPRRALIGPQGSSQASLTLDMPPLKP